MKSGRTFPTGGTVGRSSSTGSDTTPLLVTTSPSPVQDGEEATSAWWSPKTDISASLHLLTSSWLNVLLLTIPFAFASEYMHWSATTVFLLNLCGLIPLALLLGEVTEDLALRLGETIGGLLNATFGNVVELILSIAALQAGLYDVVATSLLGSILSNLLLVLGMSFFVGGLKYKIQHFNAVSSQTSGSLLLLSAIGIIIPTAAQRLGTTADEEGAAVLGLLGQGMAQDKILLLSRLTAVALLAVYIGYLIFQLGTHKDMFAGEEGEDAQQANMTLTAAGVWLAGITVIVAFLSEFLTGSIEEVSSTWGLSRSFLGFIVLPIAGNACEHITAVFVAAKDKMDLSLGVAIGSSIQIGLFAVPFVTIVGWVLGHPFSLGFDPFAALVLLLAVMHSAHMINDAESHWLEGLQLVVTYFVIATAYALSS
ncbi:hypothetical protein OEZ85_013267 [Tetradesmus obliquus]|uniref:Vacuolar cation/proton exchanger n=1 Tax=Tetradesmus obliquus TaxID=3088 RepID=A0ABY8U5F7_TETOB|nr:hypothetical protein OEZ85_013267 [Tetradesmus obliquus]